MQLHQLSGYIQSIYLAVYDDKILLLDGCCKADVKLITRYIEHDLNRPLTHLKTCVVTHMHPDHSGAANLLKQQTGCNIVTSNVTGNWYSGLDGWLMFVTDIILAKWVAGRLGKPRANIWYLPRLKNPIKVNDGGLIPGFEDWQVIESQGHTDRDISLFHLPTKKVYVADLAVKVKGKYIPPFPVFYPNRYRRSLSKIEALKPSAVILAHGGEVQISHEQYLYLVDKAPDVPMTHWRSVKAKLSRVFRG